jgi:hypothetical protein
MATEMSENAAIDLSEGEIADINKLYKEEVEALTSAGVSQEEAEKIAYDWAKDADHTYDLSSLSREALNELEASGKDYGDAITNARKSWDALLNGYLTSTADLLRKEDSIWQTLSRAVVESYAK